MTLEKIIDVTHKVIFFLKPLGRDFSNGRYKSNDNICMLHYSFPNTGVDCKYLDNNKCTYDKNNFWN